MKLKFPVSRATIRKREISAARPVEPIADLPGEEWRGVADWPYLVSNLGRVQREDHGLHGWRIKIRKTQTRSKGYLGVTLSKPVKGGGKVLRSVNIHTLVCEAFHGPKPFPGAQVLHHDDNKQNNVSSNLRWGTHKENMADSVRNGGLNFGGIHELRRIIAHLEIVAANNCALAKIGLAYLAAEADYCHDMGLGLTPRPIPPFLGCRNAAQKKG